MKRLFYTLLLALLPWSTPIWGQYATKVEVTDLSDGGLGDRAGANISALLTELNLAQAEGRTPKFSTLALDNEAKEGLGTLWEVCPFRCSETEIVERALATSRGYQVRSIPVYMVPIKGETFDSDQNQEIVINFNAQGRITGVYFSISTVNFNKIMRTKDNDVTDLRRRQVILDFVENFRTSYNRKDIPFLQKVFSDDALIITGTVVSVARGDGMVGLKADIRYKEQSKEEYLNNLRGVFNRVQRININFEDVRVVKHDKKSNYYGVTVKQFWNTNTYSDVGYLFLLIDFQDDQNPLIHVRTWQPDDPRVPLSKADIFSLSDFDIKE